MAVSKKKGYNYNVYNLLQLLINQSKDKRTVYLLTWIFFRSQKKLMDGISSLSHVYLHTIFFLIPKVCKLFGFENLIRLSKWVPGQFLVESLNKLRPWNNIQNFVLKVYIVITSKVFADFCFESPISIDFQSEILALLRPKSAKTFHESLQILSPLRKSA